MLPIIDDPVASGLTILSVEDDALVAMGTTATLEEMGHTVIEASSGLAALELLAARPDIDLLVSDQGMPGMSGVELARAARASRPDLPVVIVTGYHSLPGAEDLIRLHKPFRAPELTAAFRAAMAQPVAGGVTNSANMVGGDTPCIVPRMKPLEL